MKKLPVVLDLETKHTFRQFDEPKKLGISVVGVFDYGTNEATVFGEKDIANLFPVLEKASYIVGFNVRNFDMAVLQGYYPGNMDHFSAFDILEDIKWKIGKRVSLNELAYATLGKKKSGHGLMAIEYFREGNWEKLRQYCLDDVMLTKDLFEYGVREGKIFYLNEKGKIPISVEWKRYLEDSGKSETPLTLPF